MWADGSGKLLATPGTVSPTLTHLLLAPRVFRVFFSIGNKFVSICIIKTFSTGKVHWEARERNKTMLSTVDSCPRAEPAAAAER